jgi:HK97 family phage portal protein
MWPFKRAEVEQRAISAWPWDIGGPPPYATRTVSVERALSLVPVFAAVRLLADSIASLPLCLYKTGSHGLPVKQPQPSLFAAPSIHGTIVDWLHRAVVCMGLQGDAVGLVTDRDYYGFPTMAEWLDPQQVVVQDTQLVGPGSYMNPLWYWRGQPLPRGNIIHIPWFTMPYKIRGLSPIAAYAATAQVGLAAQDYAASWYDNGGVPPGTFQNMKQTVSKEDADLITARVTGRLKTRKVLVYGADWQYNPIAIKPNEAQFVETMQLTATQIATIYGIPPEKIGGTTGKSLTYSTVEMNTLDYLTFSLRPWLVRLETALTACFPRGTYAKFDVAEMLRSDAKTKAEIAALSLGTPSQAWKDVDEVRADYDLEPMPEPELPAAPPYLTASPVPNPNGRPVPVTNGSSNGNGQ